MHILMIAAENDALPGGKVGGIGDVVRDLPTALARQGQQVSVITPGYGLLSKNSPSTLHAQLSVTFKGRSEALELYRVEAPDPHPDVSNWVLEHSSFAAEGVGNIYCISDPDPFAIDASKFVLFCLGVAEAVTQGHLGSIDVLHCHDWHAAPLLLLRRDQPRYEALQSMRAVYTIHNLAIQGIRPLKGGSSSLEEWFPKLECDTDLLTDPRHRNCINWMRAGINLADMIHTVSPTYAREILQPTDERRHFIGGEHLEGDLQRAHEEARLVGILNGCDYSNSRESLKPIGKSRLCQIIESTLDHWVEGRSTIPSAHFYALQRVKEWRTKRRPDNFVVTSVGRLTDQKNRLLREELHGKSVLEHLLERMEDGRFLLLGSGDPRYEDFFTGIMATYPNFIFLQGYSDELSSALYSYGDLFLMPSSFEPCGISQMLAMRAGTPCLAHAVGGLVDTVKEGVTGFTFRGDGLREQAENLIERFAAVMQLRIYKPPKWLELSRSASAARFTWDKSARAMLEGVY